jgi:hypothetical protein
MRFAHNIAHPPRLAIVGVNKEKKGNVFHENSLSLRDKG